MKFKKEEAELKKAELEETKLTTGVNISEETFTKMDCVNDAVVVTEDYVRNVRSPDGHILIYDLPYWKLSVNTEYALGQYLAPKAEVVDVQVTGPKYIKYDSTFSMLCSSDQPKGYDTTIYITVTDGTVVEKDVIIAYWDKEIRDERSVDGTSPFLGTKAQYFGDIKALGIGKYIGPVYA
jgi:hypothetical protein